jgi:hypothetical protein
MSQCRVYEVEEVVVVEKGTVDLLDRKMRCFSMGVEVEWGIVEDQGLGTVIGDGRVFLVRW